MARKTLMGGIAEKSTKVSVHVDSTSLLFGNERKPLEPRKMILNTNIIFDYLVLGHKGFLGKLILNKLEWQGKKVRVIDERLTCENIESLFHKNINQNTKVFNCVASGVTPNTGDDLIDSYTNVTLLESQLKTLVKLKFASFTHFASIYENMNTGQGVSSRNSYISSKASGSNVCKSFLEYDNRIHLMYLPTVIDSSQPRGRLFADFMHAFIQGNKFHINFPTLQLQIMTFESLSKKLEILEKAVNPLQISFIRPDITLTVFNFARELNLILLQLNLPPVPLLTPENYDSQSQVVQEVRLPIIFRNQLEIYVKRIIEK